MCFPLEKSGNLKTKIQLTYIFYTFSFYKIQTGLLIIIGAFILL